MRRILYSMTIALLAVAPSGARAQSAVFCLNCSTLTQQVLNWAKQLDQMASQLQQQEMMVQRLERAVDPNSYVAQLESLQQPFTDPSQLTSVFSGWHTVPQNFNGSSTFLSANTVYRPTGSDFNAQELNANAQGLANVMAAMNTSLQSITAHIAGLDSLRGQLSTVTSQADLEALNGRINAETADIAAQNVQIESLKAQLAAEAQVNQQRQLQQQRQAVDDFAALFNGGTSSTTPSTNSSAFVAYNGN